MPRAWRCAAWLLVLGLAGCSIRIPVEPPVWAIDPGVPESHDPALTALADAIDPGPQTPLRAAMPAGLIADVPVTPPGEDPRVAAEHGLRAALLVWRERTGPAIDDATLAQLARAVAHAEAVAATGRVHPELLVTRIEAYAALDERPGELRRIVGMRTPEGAVRRLLQHNAATLLRRYAAHPDAHEVLAAVAGAAHREQDFTRVAAVRRLIVHRQVGRDGPALQLELADACYRALEPACGDAALGQARDAAGPELQATLADLQWLGEQTHAVLAATGDDLEARLERTQRLRALGRTREATTSYAALIQAAPDDARPRVGLAGLALLRGDLEAARSELGAASSLRHQDRNYHELAIALQWPRLAAVGEPRARALAELQALASGYRRFEPARAGVLAALLAAIAEPAADGSAALRGLARVQPQVAALVREFPDSPDVRRLAYMAAQVAPTADGALAVVRTPLGPGLTREGSLHELRLATWFDLAARWDRRDELPKIADAIAALPADAPARGDLLATILAVQAALAGELAPAAARQIFAHMAEDGAPPDRARALSNLAVLQALGGEPEAAIDRWTAALALDHAVQFIRLNIAGALVRYETPPRAELGPLLTTLATEAETTELRLLALAWRCILATRTGTEDQQERVALAAAWTAKRASTPGAAIPGGWSMIATPPHVRLEYSDERLRGDDTGGLILTAEVDHTYWLIVPVPGLDALLAPAAPASRRARTAG